ncbi:energy-coupled thiamine transporter ThiT [Camelliibacillus cellulosilyticus]|uniref:Energy-coupled thiamine transporter ThiT n=1 Tax=Camelliibacillus cellulosilyticus TaxID=2174486 RepID=A0ABV9GJG4_9BACL
MLQRERTLILVEGALLIAIAALLNVIKFNGPWAFGGSVSLEMVPIIVFALRRGFKWGIFAGLIYGIINFIMGPYFLNPIQFLLDYLLAFLLLGFAGLVKVRSDVSRVWTLSMVASGAIFAMVLRFLSSFVSGIVFYGSNAPKGQPVALYSLIYNGSYMLPSMIISLIVLFILAVSVPKFLVRRS